MNKIVRKHYPVEDLPETLREGLGATATVSITIEPEEPTADRVTSLDELFALRRPPYRSMDEIVADVRWDRDAWDD